MRKRNRERKEMKRKVQLYGTTIKAALKNTLSFAMSGDTWQKRHDSNTSPPSKGHEMCIVG